MRKDRQEFLRELQADFVVEAAEHRQVIVTGLLELAQSPPPSRRDELLEVIGREAHSLKGAARAVDQRDIERLCQAVESVFAEVQHGATGPDRMVLDALHAAIGGLDQLLAAAPNGPGDPPDLVAVLAALEVARARCVVAPAVPAAPAAPAPAAMAIADGPPHEAPQEAPPEASHAPHQPSAALSETVRISTARLGSLLRQTEELVAVKSSLGYYLDELHRIDTRQLRWRRAAGRPWPHGVAELAGPPQGLPGAMPAAEEGQRKALAGDLAGLTARISQDHHLLGRMVDELLLDMKQALLSPFEALLGIYPEIARDLAVSAGKEVVVTVQGGEVEVDRRILEELKDPLLHLVRNSVDHGIETPEARERCHKPRTGHITLAATPQGSRQVLVQLTDDGAGIDTARARSAAVKAGLLTAEEAVRLGEAEAQRLCLASGVSTSPLVTDLSGRGLGMAIVAEKVAKLGGTVSIESQRGAGTTIALLLPLSLATFRGVVVRVGEHLLALPTRSVERATRLGPEDCRAVEGRPTAVLDGHVTAVVGLGEALGLSGEPWTARAPALVVVAGELRTAFVVDEVRGEQEGLVKQLGPQLPRVRSVTGVTVLADGRVVPILDVDDLLAAAADVGGVGPLNAVVPAPPVAVQTIVVAEDSFTSRAMLRNILESAGYRVRTAVDGLQALKLLQDEPCDLLVSDVEMPYLNGFELTTKLRADRRWAELPVVLVTALDSPADRERGLVAGADAYIVKGSFEQSNLLEVVSRLI